MLMKHRVLFLFLLSLLVPVFLGCSSDDVDSIDDVIDVTLDPPERRPIDPSIMGVNNFFVNREFGSIAEQFREIRSTLGLRYVRVLFAWTDAVQPTPSDEPDYSFYDDIIGSIPAGIEVDIVLAHTPSWMAQPANWVEGNPRLTWVRNWLLPTVERYAGAPGVSSWEVWNEPDTLFVDSDAALELSQPANYIELLAYANDVIRNEAPGTQIVLAATRSIQQNFPGNLNYNRSLRNFGAEDLVDIWNVHYYGEQFERVVQGGGVASFLNSIRLPIWITESGETGPNEQLSYVETAWPFLQDEIAGIERFYYYEFGSANAVQDNYGLRTTDPAFPVSDLYIHLRDR